MLLPILLAAQLKEFEIREIPAPPGIALTIEHPDCAQLIIHSTIVGLSFESNMAGIREQRHIAKEDKYLVFILPQRQIISVKASGFIEAQLGAAFTLGAKERKYFSIADKVINSGSDKGSFVLSSVPSGAQIIIDGFPGFREKTPYRFDDYMAMTYAVTLKLHGYEDYRYSMQISSNRQGSATLELKSAFAELVVISSPPAELYLNGTSKGSTPQNFQGANGGLAPGEYRILLKKDRYQTIEETLVLQAGDSIQKRYALYPLFTEAFIRSEPPGSSVYMNNNLLGVTPLDLTGAEKGLDAGTHTIRIVPRQEYLNIIESQVELNAGEVFSRTFSHEDQRRWLGIRVSETPFEAYLDGIRVPELELGDEIELESDTYALRVIYTGKDRDKYPVYEQSVRLLHGERRMLDVQFNAFRASLKLLSDYSDVKLLIKNKHTGHRVFKGNTDVAIELFPGRYEVLASKRHFNNLVQEIEVNSEPEQLFEFNPVFKSNKTKAYRNEMLLSIGTVASLGALTYYSWQKSEAYYRDYLATSSSAQAETLRKQTKDWDIKTQILIGAETAATLWLSNAIIKYIQIKGMDAEVKRIQRFDSRL